MADVVFPTLDLGELGAQIEAQIQDSEPENEPDAPAVEASETPADNSPVEDPPSGESGSPAADAGDDFEARYQERFKADYAERSKADIGKLRSSLDRRINDQRVQLEDLRGDLDVAQVGFDRAVAMLREYDPQAADNLLATRDQVQNRAAERRKLDRYERQGRLSFRENHYRQAFGDEISPDEPDLLAAYEAGNYELERALMRQKTLERGLVLENGRYVRPVTVPESALVHPQAQTPPAQPQTPPRDPATGQFVKADPLQARIAATREREQARGVQPMTSGPPAKPKKPTTIDEASKIFERGLADILSRAVS